MAPETTAPVHRVDVPWIVSVDDHVIEPPLVVDVAAAREATADVGPRVERLPAGELALAGARTSSGRAPTARSSTTGCTRTSTSR